MTDQLQEAEVVKAVPGKLGWSIKAPTPFWATLAFRIQFCANKAVMFWLAGTDSMTAAQIKSKVLLLTSIDIFVWALGRSIGIKPPEESKN